MKLKRLFLVACCSAAYLGSVAFGRDFVLGPVSMIEQVDGSNPRDLRAADGIVVWHWKGNSATRTIRAYDFDADHLVVIRSGSSVVHRPDTSANVVVWSELENRSGAHFNLMRHDLATGATLHVTMDDYGQVYPSMDGDTVAFEHVLADFRREIWTAQSPTWNPTRLLSDPSDSYQTPDISKGQLLVKRISGNEAFMEVHDLDSGQIVFQRDASTSSGVPPRIAGSTMAWYDYRLSQDRLRVLKIDTGQEWRLPTSVFSLREDIVAYVDENQFTLNILDLVDGTVSELRSVRWSLVPGGVAVDENRITWVQQTYLPGGEWGVYTAELIPEPATLALLAIGGLALLRRRTGYGA